MCSLSAVLNNSLYVSADLTQYTQTIEKLHPRAKHGQSVVTRGVGAMQCDNNGATPDRRGSRLSSIARVRDRSNKDF